VSERQQAALRTLVLAALPLAATGPALAAPAASAPANQAVDLSSSFPGFRAAFVLHDVREGRTVRFNADLARRRVAPCSTFKIASSLIGLETGVVRDASFVLPWDGQRRPVDEWNRDHDLRSAIRDSVVWYYQELARRVGPQRMEQLVHAFGYGNGDTSGGSDRFWLGSTLRISPDEQVRFLERLHTGALPVSARSVAIVKEILVREAAAPDLVYRGKTGTCTDAGSAAPHGWWVGSVENGERLHVFAALIQGEGASGRACRPLAEDALRRLGVLPASGSAGANAAAAGAPARPRARDLGFEPGVLAPGRWNAITDVPGVRVGHSTLTQGDRVRTGVTVVVPHEGNLFLDKVQAGVFVGNAFGKMAGTTQVRELGTLETPVALTNTLAVGTSVEALVAWTLGQAGNEDVRSVNAVVGEVNDGALNDIRGGHVRREHVVAALSSATSGPVAEGNVGGGTGAQAFGWKGGIGTASRVLPAGSGGFTLGALVQANFGGVLVMDGVPVGKALGRHPFVTKRPAAADGSCVIVVATDAPLSGRDLERLAARAVYALARTGSSYANGSGDYAIAFSTAAGARVRHGELQPRPRALLPSDAVSPLFEAVLEAVEEAVLNALLRADTMTGNGITVEAIPVDRLESLLLQCGRRR
jgi:D-aminopeptidase